MKKLWIGFILLVVLLTAVGLAAAEETITPGVPVSSGCYNGEDVAIFRFTPADTGVYEFHTVLAQNEYWWGVSGLILDEDETGIPDA